MEIIQLIFGVFTFVGTTLWFALLITAYDKWDNMASRASSVFSCTAFVGLMLLLLSFH